MLRFNSKSQAALEFLATYGWAFAIILMAIGALYYLGVFDFSKYLPQECTFTSQFPCMDFSMKSTDGTIRLKLLNNIGEEIHVESLEITSDAANPLTCTQPTNLGRWDVGKERDFVFTDCQDGVFIKGERIETKITLIYHAVDTPAQPQHTLRGKIIGSVYDLEPSPECDDNIDNDIDGCIDMDDSDCSGPSDDSESGTHCGVFCLIGTSQIGSCSVL